VAHALWRFLSRLLGTFGKSAMILFSNYNSHLGGAGRFGFKMVFFNINIE
jgi:hypothetical protein